MIINFQEFIIDLIDSNKLLANQFPSIRSTLLNSNDHNFWVMTSRKDVLKITPPDRQIFQQLFAPQIIIIISRYIPYKHFNYLEFFSK